LWVCAVGRVILIKSHQNNFSPHFFYVEFNSKQLLFSWKNSKNASLVGKNALFVYKGICPKIHRKNWHFSFLHFLLHFFRYPYIAILYDILFHMVYVIKLGSGWTCYTDLVYTLFFFIRTKFIRTSRLKLSKKIRTFQRL